MNLIGITGDNLKSLRNAKNWTQKNLADLLKIDTVTVKRWEDKLDEEASIKNTMYAVLLPILVSEKIDLKIAKELHDPAKREKLYSTLAATTSLNPATKNWGNLVGIGLLAPIAMLSRGWIVPGLAALALPLAKRGLNTLMEQNANQSVQTNKLPEDVLKAIIMRELLDIQCLYQLQKDAWKKIEMNDY